MIELIVLLTAGCLLGIMGIALLIVVSMFRTVTQQLVRMNERLLVLVGTRDGGEAVGRALVASSRESKKDLLGVANEPLQEKNLRPGISGKQHTITIGSK